MFRALVTHGFNLTAEAEAIRDDLEAKLGPILRDAVDAGVDPLHLYAIGMAALTHLTGDLLSDGPPATDPQPAKTKSSKTPSRSGSRSRARQTSTTAATPPVPATPPRHPFSLDPFAQWAMEKGWSFLIYLVPELQREIAEWTNPGKDFKILDTATAGCPDCTQEFQVALSEYFARVQSGMPHPPSPLSLVPDLPGIAPMPPLNPVQEINWDMDAQVVQWALAHGWDCQILNVEGAKRTQWTSPSKHFQCTCPHFRSGEPFLNQEVRQAIRSHYEEVREEIARGLNPTAPSEAHPVVESQLPTRDEAAPADPLLAWAVRNGWSWHEEQVGSQLMVRLRMPDPCSVTFILPMGPHEEPTLTEHAAAAIQEHQKRAANRQISEVGETRAGTLVAPEPVLN